MSDKPYPEGGDYEATNFHYIKLTQGDYFGAQYLRPGGIVVDGIAEADLKIGDVVYLSALDSFNKNTTVAKYVTLSGVVVGGGDNTTYPYGKIVQEDNVLGKVIALGQPVLVLVYGVAKVIADAALATIGTKLTGGATTAGRAGSASAAAGNYIGVQLTTSSAAGDIIRVFVGAAH